MHIIYIHQYFTTPDQKSGTRSYEMARRLIRAGHQVSMICGTTELTDSGAKPGDVSHSEIDGIDVYQIAEPYSNSMGFAKRWFVFLKFAGKALKTAKTLKNVDLVFATSTPLTVGAPGRKAAKYHRCPFVFEVRDLWPELPIAMGIVRHWPLKWYLKQMELRTYRAASRCVALAPGIKEGIAEAGFPSDKIVVIPNSCDLDLFMPTETNSEVDNDSRFGKPGDFRLVFTGAHGLANGLDAVLDAIAEIKKRDLQGVRFCFIGTGGLKTHLMERSKNEGLDEYISWVEPVKKRELARILPQMDVGMQILKNIPAFYRGTSPNKFFDYLSCGIPVLNNYPGWLAEYIKENNCGTVVPPDDPKAFADTVIQMMGMRKKLKEMGRNARNLAETTFSRHILGDLFVKTMEDTVKCFQQKR
jgi:glycosyltransferase involved in cell wall biosynthesis